MPQLEEIRQMVRQTIVDTLRLQMSPAELDGDRPLYGKDGVGLGSLEIFELLTALEERYALRIPDEAMERLNSVNALADHIAAHVGVRPASS
jgi:acyl carrier protein